MSWRPLSLRGKADARFDEPSEGLPAWLRGPVFEWMRNSFISWDWEGESYISPETLNALQLDFRLDPPFSGIGSQAVLSELMTRVTQDDEFALDVLDWMLHHWKLFREGHQAAEWASQLNQTLLQGGSVWEVTTPGDDFGLSRRAVGPVTDVLEQTATEATRAHHHLAESWSKLTGRNPDPSGTYREAVRAVEAVAKPILLPSNARATLGQMIAAMKDKPAKWTVTIGTVADVRAQMEAVWTGQLDRHGTDDESVPLNVSPAQADAAFSACLNLVRLFAGGHVVRVPESNGNDA